jgi:hypothetical protein
LTVRAVCGTQVAEGSVVRETWYTSDPLGVPSDGTPNRHIRGEALILALGEGTYVFAMLDGYSAVGGRRERSMGAWTPGEIIAQMTLRERSDATVARDRARAYDGGAVMQVAPEDLPVLVGFRDIEDKYSATIIQPDQISSVSPGWSLGECTVQTTTDPLTSGPVSSLLPWTRQEHAVLTSNGVPGDAGTITSGDFERTWS